MVVFVVSLLSTAVCWEGSRITYWDSVVNRFLFSPSVSNAWSPPMTLLNFVESQTWGLTKLCITFLTIFLFLFFCFFLFFIFPIWFAFSIFSPVDIQWNLCVVCVQYCTTRFVIRIVLGLTGECRCFTTAVQCLLVSPPSTQLLCTAFIFPPVKFY